MQHTGEGGSLGGRDEQDVGKPMPPLQKGELFLERTVVSIWFNRRSWLNHTIGK